MQIILDDFERAVVEDALDAYLIAQEDSIAQVPPGDPHGVLDQYNKSVDAAKNVLLRLRSQST